MVSADRHVPWEKRAVEIGTSSGYSTVWLALGVRASGGNVFTHEIDPEKVKLASENSRKAGVDELVAIIEGNAHETIKRHKEPIDVLFLDAEKKGYVDHIEKLLALVRSGGVILGHDMHRPMPDPRYIEAITTNPDLDTSFIMMESLGISMTVKKRSFLPGMVPDRGLSPPGGHVLKESLTCAATFRSAF